MYEIETRSPEAIQAEINSRMEKRQKKRRTWQKEEDDDDEEEEFRVQITPRKRQRESMPRVSLSNRKVSATVVQEPTETLVNSPSVKTSTVKVKSESFHESEGYQGTHLMDTLANIALSAEAHNFDWLQQNEQWPNNSTVVVDEPNQEKIASFLSHGFMYHPELRVKQTDIVPVPVLLNGHLGEQTLQQLFDTI
jgi:hypothetical protein